MVHPLVITAAATAGIGAAVAFEVAVFRPWRDENWPHGFGEGVRNEFLKLRREVEQAVNEIQDDLRTLRDGRRRGSGSRDRHRRLSDDELDDFRRGVGEEASRESAQHEFELHERQASAYRDRLRASMTESMGSRGDQERGLRRRRTAGTEVIGDEGPARKSIINVPVVDTRKDTSPEAPHHSVGAASPKVAASPPSGTKAPLHVRIGDDSTATSTSSHLDAAHREDKTETTTNDLLGLDSDAQSSLAVHEQLARSNTCDPFADIVDGTASSWHAVFSDRSAKEADETAHGTSQERRSPSPDVLVDDGHIILDTNGLSQTLSDQQHSFHDLYADAHSSNASHTSGSPYRSNRALNPPSLDAPSTGSRSMGAESEPDFDVISDTADSEGRWSQVHAPPSPTISIRSEPVAMCGVDTNSIHSDGQESWAELSRYGSDEEGSARSETRVRSHQE